jgi:hypothetical protein
MTDRILSERPAGYVGMRNIEGGELDMMRHEWEQVQKATLVIMELHPKVYPNGSDDTQMIETRMQDAGFRQAERLNDVYLWRR